MRSPEEFVFRRNDFYRNTSKLFTISGLNFEELPLSTSKNLLRTATVRRMAGTIENRALEYVDVFWNHIASRLQKYWYELQGGEVREQAKITGFDRPWRIS